MIKNNQKSYDSLMLNLKKSQGMMKKIEQMIQDDIYCADIAQQINATIGLLKQMNNELFKSHLLCCGKKELVSSDPKKVEKFVEELVRVWDVAKRK